MVLLSRIVLSKTPPAAGATGVQVGAGCVVVPRWCPASVIPQSSAFSETVLDAIRLPSAGPFSS